MKSRGLLLALVLVVGSKAAGTEWIRPGINTNQPVWGIRGGLLRAVAPAGFRAGEPRGLIRLGYPVLRDGGYDLINFIAIEPIVSGKRGFSELERSYLDGVAGKRIWSQGPGDESSTNLASGTLEKRANGLEELRVVLRVESFENGAHLRLQVSQSNQKPDEMTLSIFREPGSAPLDYCILTATMGNMARARQLWLGDGVVRSLDLYREYRETAFAPHKEFPLSRLHRTPDKGIVVALTNDEQDPAVVYPFPGSEHWHYAGFKVTQYWSKAAASIHDDLTAVVNGRYTYWRSAQPIPGGVAFENFELRERFYEGQTFTFGITRRIPRELGFKTDR